MTTTDIERNLHPPDKQDVAARLALEVRRVAYGDATVTARGPELLHTSRDKATGAFQLHFSNNTLTTHAGIFVGDAAACGPPHAGTASDMVVTVAGLCFSLRLFCVVVGMAGVSLRAECASV